MITFDEAVALIVEVAGPLGSETLGIEHAAGRVIAEPVVARIGSPRSDVSTMDGYAVRDGDLEALPARMTIVGESFPGGGWSGTIGTSECVRIFTGAPVPAGADRIVIQENVHRDGDTAIIGERPGGARYIRARGGDFAQGDQLLAEGQLLHARAIVAAAAADVGEVQVFTQSRVTILSTGDELITPGTAARKEGSIPDSVALGVAAMTQQWGGTVIGRPRLRDDLAEMSDAAAEAAAGSDLVIVTGGASVGERDFAKAMFEPLGLDLVFSRVAMKPGKPVWLGRLNTALVMGLPGNPTSALVTARLLLAPLLCGLTGRNPLDALRWRSAQITEALESCGPRETFHRARWCDQKVELISNQDSGAQRPLLSADLLVRQRTDVPPPQLHDLVDILDF